MGKRRERRERGDRARRVKDQREEQSPEEWRVVSERELAQGPDWWESAILINDSDKIDR